MYNVKTEQIYKNTERIYSTGEIIYEAGSGADIWGIVTEGTAFLESTDRDGIRRIIDIYTKGEAFISKCFPVSGIESVCLIAKTACEVLIFDSGAEDEASSDDENKTGFERVNLESFNRVLAHIHILGQHTLRQKIIAFLEYAGLKDKKDKVELKMSFTDIADFIGVDRSAMMRELKRMENDKIIQRGGKTIKLI